MSKKVWLITMYGLKWNPEGFYDGPFSQTVYVIGRSRKELSKSRSRELN